MYFIKGNKIIVLCLYFLLNIGTYNCFDINLEKATTLGQIPLSTDLFPTKPSSSLNLPPIVFPINQTVFRILPNNNETVLNKLQHGNQSVLESEVEDLNENADQFIKVNPTNTNTLEDDKSSIKIDSLQTTTDSEYYDDPKDDTENLQKENKNKPKVELEEQFNRQNNDNLSADIKDNTEVDLPSLRSGHIIAITSFSVIIICMITGLVIWRSRSENRYGMRQRLVNEEDNYPNNDIREYEV